MSNDDPSGKKEWKALAGHQKEISRLHIQNLFKDDPDRFEKFHVNLPGLLLDYSKNLLTQNTMDKLFALARACDVETKRDRMFAGEKINTSEDRAVLHTALRAAPEHLTALDKDISDYVLSSRQKIEKISTQLRKEKTFTDVVNIGVGGSDLGPHMACEAMKHMADGPDIHFISNIDPLHVNGILQKLNPEKTLIIITTKSFTTFETITNAKIAKTWLTESLGAEKTKEHMIAVTAEEQKARDFGVSPENILPLKDWIGGRYSLWSFAGLPIALSAGFENFQRLLDGAQSIDRHFLETPLEKNIPVIMALVGIWHRNFLGYETQAILPYAQSLHRLPAYIQQLDMESNGKHVSKDGDDIDYNTGPVIFGEPGTNAQHAFMQLFHQGTSIVPCDLIGFLNTDDTGQDTHKILVANLLAQGKALMEGTPEQTAAHKKLKGSKPSNTLLLDRLDACHLGMLLALYEHKIFVQGIIWNINSFDQWGVELGKTTARKILENMDNSEENKDFDSSTKGLLSYVGGKTGK